MQQTEQHIDHEVRIRSIESKYEDIKETLKELRSDIKSNFHWVLGTIITQIAVTITLFGGIILHLAKLI